MELFDIDDKSEKPDLVEYLEKYIFMNFFQGFTSISQDCKEIRLILEIIIS